MVLSLLSVDVDEINGYYADKTGKHYRNCNSIFELGNKLH
jgi:hypothetical protein